MCVGAFSVLDLFLSVSLSLCTCLSLSLFSQSVSCCLSPRVSVCLSSLCLPVSLPLCLSPSVSVCLSSLCLPFSLSVSLFIFHLFSICLTLSAYLSFVSLCLCCIVCVCIAKSDLCVLTPLDPQSKCLDKLHFCTEGVCVCVDDTFLHVLRLPPCWLEFGSLSLSYE